MKPRQIFFYQTTMQGELEDLVAIHEDPGAIKLLTPFPLRVQIQRDTRRGLTQGELEFTVWIGPVPVRWLAVHGPGPNPHSFVDRMQRGPLESWEHTHILEATPEGVRLAEEVVFRHGSGPRGLLTGLFFGGPALRFLFAYRHWRVRRSMRRRMRERATPPATTTSEHIQ